MVSTPATGEIGDIDFAPAATLLLPYFAVDLEDPNALTTLFSINNAFAEPAIAHVVLRTDLGVQTLDFNVYLTGYDVVTINLRDLFTAGKIPQTTNDDMPSGLSPVGPFSVTTHPITRVGPGSASCSSRLPPGGLPAVVVKHLRDSHTGRFSELFEGCSAVPYGDNVARGYITIDNVNTCSLFGPNDGDFYFGNPAGLNNLNQLWGDVFWVDSKQNFAQGEALVHIEASDELTTSDYTFYRRYAGSASDQREGLASLFGVRYSTSFGPISGGTDLIVWRDSKVVRFPFVCGAPIRPLQQHQVVVFDEMENPDVLLRDAILFPWSVSRTRVGGATFAVPFSSGWIRLNLNNFVAGQTFDPLPDGEAMQNWVIAIWDADDRFSVGYDAMQIDNVTFGATDSCLTSIVQGGPISPECPPP